MSCPGGKDWPEQPQQPYHQGGRTSRTASTSSTAVTPARSRPGQKPTVLFVMYGDQEVPDALPDPIVQQIIGSLRPYGSA